MRTAIVSVEYDSSIAHKILNYFSDSLEMNSDLLSEIGADWRSTIEVEIKHCEDVVKAVGKYSQNLYVASGGSDNNVSRIMNNAKEQLYYRLDQPFRKWLISINPDILEKDKKTKEWHDTVREIAFDYADELMENIPECAIIGRKPHDSDILYSAPKAKNIFMGEVNKIYEKNERK